MLLLFNNPYATGKKGRVNDRMTGDNYSGRSQSSRVVIVADNSSLLAFVNACTGRCHRARTPPQKLIPMIRDIVQPLREPLVEFFYTLDNRQAYEAEQAIDLAQDTVMYGLRREVMHDNAAGLTNLFSGRADVKNHPITTAIAGEYTQRLHTELNVPGNVAGAVSAHVVPAIIQAMITHALEGDSLDPNKFSNLIAGDLGTLRGSLEKGIDADRGLGDKATGILGFGIGGRYDTSKPGSPSDPDGA